MKIATWNVNGIRARQGEVQQWIERERPDVVCLQEIKAASDQIPMFLCEMEGYWCYWHGGKGYSGVGLHVSKTLAPDRPIRDAIRLTFENGVKVDADIVIVALGQTKSPIFAGLRTTGGSATTTDQRSEAADSSSPSQSAPEARSDDDAAAASAAAIEAERQRIAAANQRELAVSHEKPQTRRAMTPEERREAQY